MTTFTDGSNIPPGYKVRYLIYFNYSDTHGGKLLEKYVDEFMVDKETPIAKTGCIIQLKDKGQFIIGVQSMLYDKEEKIRARSAIAWSDNKKYTNNNPFVVQVGK